MYHYLRTFKVVFITDCCKNLNKRYSELRNSSLYSLRVKTLKINPEPLKCGTFCYLLTVQGNDEAQNVTKFLSQNVAKSTTF